MSKFLLYLQIGIIVFFSVVHFVGCSENGEKLKSKFGTIIIDDKGEKITIREKPTRVISLAPNITEIIFELGEESTLKGNTIYCNYPAESKKITKVGDLLNTNYEKIKNLKTKNNTKTKT